MNRRWRRRDDTDTIADPRRWPNPWQSKSLTFCDLTKSADVFRRVAVNDVMKVTDDDLAVVVLRALQDWFDTELGPDEDEAEAALISISDAAIDEQDRRNDAKHPRAP